ncbi:MAG: ABC transporter permease subunit [Flavobacteriaceae bacterium]|nr:ABC transporter permease subunit [Flavobacteriaceae bacterium]MDG2387599.1 ABC transporter permease subunit [Flavobacteriaceae bacterium]
MWSIAKRELHFYFSQLSGYLVVGGYLLVTALTLWFFNTPYNLLNTELGSFDPFFEFTPLLFLFLLPAISMRSFSEEFSLGTFELLLTKPLKPAQIFGGKLIGVGLILSIALLPTILHAVALESLFQDGSELDWGKVMSSYFALILLACLFLVTSICASLLFQSQVASFLVALLTCFMHLYFWSFLADLTYNMTLFKFINNIGARVHYNNLSRGIIALGDLIYFLGFILTFFSLGVQLIKFKKS